MEIILRTRHLKRENMSHFQGKVISQLNLSELRTELTLISIELLFISRGS